MAPLFQQNPMMPWAGLPPMAQPSPMGGSGTFGGILPQQPYGGGMPAPFNPGPRRQQPEGGVTGVQAPITSTNKLFAGLPTFEQTRKNG